MSAFKRASRNFPLSVDDLFQLAVSALEVPGDWMIKMVDPDKHVAMARTRMRFPAAPHTVRVMVTPARGYHTQETSQLTVKSHPIYGIGGGTDMRSAGADNVAFVIDQVTNFFDVESRE